MEIGILLDSFSLNISLRFFLLFYIHNSKDNSSIENPTTRFFYIYSCIRHIPTKTNFVKCRFESH